MKIEINGKIIEYPANIGDTAYIVAVGKQNAPFTNKVKAVIIKEVIIKNENKIVTKIEIPNNHLYTDPWYGVSRSRVFGKDLFLTKEEALKVIEQMKQKVLEKKNDK